MAEGSGGRPGTATVLFTDLAGSTARDVLAACADEAREVGMTRVDTMATELLASVGGDRLS